MKAIFLWLAIIVGFSVYVYRYNHAWVEEMDARFGEVYITTHGERYHKSYHYEDRNTAISMFTAYKRHRTPCGVCHPREMPDFEKFEAAIPWYVRHWFISMVLFSVLYVYLYFRWEENKSNK
jgi:hypothetical protein